MTRLVAIAFALLSIGCATLATRPTVSNGEPLSPTELAIAEAALRAEIQDYRGESPVVVLDETSPWMPPDEGEPERPPEVPLEDWLAQNPPIPAALRAANAKAISASRRHSRRRGAISPGPFREAEQGDQALKAWCETNQIKIAPEPPSA
jgi:hypothetical protein